MEPQIQAPTKIRKSEPFVRLPTEDGSLTADFHVHSRYSSDSLSTVDELVRGAIEKRVGVIGITDHYVDKAFADLSRNAPAVLGPGYGVDISRDVHHHTDGRLAPDFVKGQGSFDKRVVFTYLLLLTKGKSTISRIYDDTLLEINRLNGLAIIPHPCNTLSHGIGAKRLGELASAARTRHLIDAIEVFNANGSFPMFWSNARSEKLAARFQLPGVASSDAHQVRHLGRAVTILREPLDLTSDSNLAGTLRDSLRSGVRYVKESVPIAEFFDWFLIPKNLIGGAR